MLFRSIAKTNGLVGRTLASLELGGARLATIVRRGQRLSNPAAETIIEVADTLVVSGTLDEVSAAEARIRG